jgi:hypothetical protein
MQWLSSRTLLPATPLSVRVPLNSRPNWIVNIENTGAANIESASYQRVGVTTPGAIYTVVNTTETPLPLVPGATMTFRGTGEALASLLTSLTSAAGTTVKFQVNAP